MDRKQLQAIAAEAAMEAHGLSDHALAFVVGVVVGAADLQDPMMPEDVERICQTVRESCEEVIALASPVDSDDVPEPPAGHPILADVSPSEDGDGDGSAGAVG